MKKIGILAVLFALSFNASAALLQGETITYSYLTPNVDTVGETSRFSVGETVEITESSYIAGTLDFSDTNILLTFEGSGEVRHDREFTGFVIEDTTREIADFTNVTINADTNVFGFSLGMITVLADSIMVNLKGIVFTNNSVLSLDINTPSAVPIPAAFFMFAPALLGFFGFRRRI